VSAKRLVGESPVGEPPCRRTADGELPSGETPCRRIAVSANRLAAKRLSANRRIGERRNAVSAKRRVGELPSGESPCRRTAVSANGRRRNAVSANCPAPDKKVNHKYGMHTNIHDVSLTPGLYSYNGCIHTCQGRIIRIFFNYFSQIRVL